MVWRRRIIHSGAIPAACAVFLASAAVIQSRPWLAFVTLLFGVMAGMQLQVYIAPEEAQEAIWSE